MSPTKPATRTPKTTAPMTTEEPVNGGTPTEGTATSRKTTKVPITLMLDPAIVADVKAVCGLRGLDYSAFFTEKLVNVAAEVEAAYVSRRR